MSDPTHYRWTNQSNGAWVDTESMRQELVADGVLVPVEPDYEAAIETLSEYENYVIDVTAGMARGPVRLPKDAARLIVDAALGDTDG